MKRLRVDTGLAFLLAVGVVMPCAIAAHGANDYPQSAESAISGALANVKSRYRAKLGHYGLAEEYFDETNGACDLKCDNTAFCTPPKWG